MATNNAMRGLCEMTQSVKGDIPRIYEGEKVTKASFIRSGGGWLSKDGVALRFHRWMTSGLGGEQGID